MKYKFKANSELEKFGSRVYNALVENFPKTYFVGGMVRDALLKRQVADIDIATSAKPVEVVEILKKYFIGYNIGYINLGVVIASQDAQTCAIATFRQETKSQSRYPKVKFVKSEKEDAQRRDFTINALYLSQKNGKLLDFYKGLSDIKNKKIKFIGEPEGKIKADPLRIVRALRFAMQLKFKLDKSAKKAILNNLALVSQLTKSKLNQELGKLENEKNKILIKAALFDKKILTNNF